MAEIFNKDVSILGDLTLVPINATGNFLTLDGINQVRVRTPSEVLADIGGFNLDQTVPQTVVNGTPIFSEGINTTGVQFDTSATPLADNPGLLQWNAESDTLDLSANGVTYQLGQEIAPLVKNQTGALIPNGTPVRFAGAVGASGRVLVAPAIADGSIPSSYILGLTTEDIANGSDGHVTWFGQIRKIDTTGTPYGEVWADGDIIYVSPTTAGSLTNIPPQAPNPQIFMGVVVDAHATVGTIFARPSWRGKITDLEDVNGTPLTTTGQILVWDNTSEFFDPTSNISDFMSSGQQLAESKILVANEFLSSYDSVTGLFTSAVPEAYTWGDHSLVGYELLSNKGAASGYAPLDSGSKIPNQYLPALAITETFVVASEVLMLGLTGAETGDVAVRTDESKSYILQGTDYSNIAHWQELLTPTDSVQSVNGLTGVVTLDLAFTPSTGILGITGGNTVDLGFTLTDTTNWDTAYTNRITSLTNTGNSGASTLLANVLNIPNYTLAGLGYTGALDANNYVLPSATSTVLGGIKLFSNTVQTIAATAVSATASRTYGTQVNASGQAVVNVPWVNTTYSVISDANLSNTVSTTGGLITGQRINTWANSRGLTTAAISNWNTAYGWGDHALAGYLTSETDSQTLSWVDGTNTLSISNGNSVIITGFADSAHNHSGVYEPVFTKNTAFNKNFGTTAGTVAEGNDSRINNGQTAFGWGDHSGLYSVLSHTHAFNDLTSKTSATGTYSTSGYLQAGRNSGGVAMTINDGYGNANLTFNHVSGIPEQDGNAARIHVNTDSLTDAKMSFETGSGGTNGVAFGLTERMAIYDNLLDVAVNIEAPRLLLLATDDASLTSTLHPFQIGLTSGSNIAMDNNEIMARFNGAADILRINREGGNVNLFDLTSAVLDVNGNVEANQFIKNGGTASQFLKADGSSDSNTYLTSFDITTQTDPKYIRSDVADDKNSGDLRFYNGVKATFGTTDTLDMDIYHDSANAQINVNEGKLLVSLYEDDFVIRDNTTTRFTFGRTTGDFTPTGDVNLTSNSALDLDGDARLYQTGTVTALNLLAGSNQFRIYDNGVQRIDIDKSTGNFLTTGKITAEGNVQSHYYKMWNDILGGGTMQWETIATITIGQGLYKGYGAEVEILEPQTNFGASATMHKALYNVSVYRSGASEDSNNSVVIHGIDKTTPTFRAMKVQDGAGVTPMIVELQVRMGSTFKDVSVKLRQTSGDATLGTGGSVVYYTDSDFETITANTAGTESLATFTDTSYYAVNRLISKRTESRDGYSIARRVGGVTDSYLAAFGTSTASNQFVFGGSTTNDEYSLDNYLTVGANSVLSFTTSGTGAGTYNILHTNNVNTELTQFLRSDEPDTKTSGELRFNDSVQLIFGDTDESRLYSSSAETRWDLINGDLLIRNQVGTPIFTFGRTTGNLNVTGTITADGYIDAQTNDSQWSPDTAGGVWQHKITKGDDTYLNGSTGISFENGNHSIYHNDGYGNFGIRINNYIGTVATVQAERFTTAILDALHLNITETQAAGNFAFEIADSTGASNDDAINFTNAFQIFRLYTNTRALQVLSDSTYDIGTTGMRYRELFVDDITVTNGIDSSTLGTFSASQFLRSDVPDTKTAGTLRFDNGVLATWGSLDTSALDISHDGTNALIENNAGLINIKSDVGTQFDSRIILDATTDAQMTIKWEVNDANRYVIGSQLGVLATGTTNDIINYTYGGINGSWGVYTNALRRLTVDGNGRTAIGSITAPASQLHIYESTVTTGAETGVTIEQASTGDALLHLKVPAANWTMGIDNSDGDAFKIEKAATFGTKAALRADASSGALEGLDAFQKSIVRDSNVTHTIGPSGAYEVRTFDGATAITVTVNSDSLDYIGQTAEIEQYGSATVTIVAGTATLRINANDTLVADGINSRIAIQKMSSTAYRVFGQLVPA